MRVIEKCCTRIAGQIDYREDQDDFFVAAIVTCLL